MSAIDVLRQIKQARKAAGQQKVVEWGNADFITEIGVENLSRSDLRNHLEARDLDTTGTRVELIERLRGSISDEQLNRFAYAETLDTDFLIQADIEQRGSVYTIGRNDKGQLGVGDTSPRLYFQAVQKLRGIGVCFVSAGVDLCYAVTESHDVYVWGGGGVGRSGINPKRAEPLPGEELLPTSGPSKLNWLEPQLMKDLVGEEIISVSVGSSHCLANGAGGDCFVWGDGDAGQLGLGNLDHHPNIAINNSFPAVASASAGGNHSVVLIAGTGQIYTWGHGANGRLGVGFLENVGAKETERFYFPLPQTIPTLEPIRQISCGVDHTLAYGASGVWSWGNGAGGRLGLGDQKDRLNPCLVPRLKGRSIIIVFASTWHSMALVNHPPMLASGWVYTWGTGYHGQLGQETRLISLLPETVEYFITYHLPIKFITAGSHHCAAITTEGEMYTWGSNKYNCLARDIDERGVQYTATPGHVGGFGSLVNRIGRGLPRHISCGTEYTAVVTYPYQGPDLDIAQKLMEEAKLREQEAMLQGQGPQF